MWVFNNFAVDNPLSSDQRFVKNGPNLSESTLMQHRKCMSMRRVASHCYIFVLFGIGVLFESCDVMMDKKMRKNGNEMEIGGSCFSCGGVCGVG